MLINIVHFQPLYPSTQKYAYTQKQSPELHRFLFAFTSLYTCKYNKYYIILMYFAIMSLLDTEAAELSLDQLHTHLLSSSTWGIIP